MKRKQRVKTNERVILLLNCVVYNSKKLRFVKEQDGSVLLGSWRTKKPLSKITLVDPLLF